MSGRAGLPDMLLDRRAFLGGAGFAAGAVVVTALVPLSVVHALPADVPLSVDDSNWTGHVDDVCGHWPPYSHPIPYGRSAEAQVIALANVDPIDLIFVA